MIKRKIQSGIKKISAMLINLMAKSKIYFLEENIILGNNVSIGSGVVIKTTDNGKIMIGNNVTIEKNSYIYAQDCEVKIGSNSFIGNGSQIVAEKSIIIGKDCLIAAYSIIRDANHGIRKKEKIKDQLNNAKLINIGDDVWIGAHSTIVAGVVIEKGAIIGANSVVTSNIKSYTIVAGVPAKFIKERA